MVAWEVLLLEEVEDWFFDLLARDADTAQQVAAAIDVLEAQGPTLGRPLVDRIKGGGVHHLKELRPGSAGGSEVRILFAFDPKRRAVLLLAGDKAGAWSSWYETNIPIAVQRYQAWIEQ